MTRLSVGEFEIISFVENRCYVDGGSMYGVIPKSIWSKLTPCDENNLVPLDTNLLLIKAGRSHILIDCGIGDLLTERERKVYACHTASSMDESFIRLGLTPDDIDFVIPTHLHLDHIGGAFIEDATGNPAPRFPKARHVIRRKEWETAMSPDDRSRVSYPTDRLKCLAHLVDLIDDETEIVPGVAVVRSGGHTRGHQVIEISTGDQAVIYCGDMIPTTGHLRPPYIAASDLYPLETLEYKKHLLDRISEGNLIIAFDHDIETKFARLSSENGRVDYHKTGEPFLARMRSCSENIRDTHRETG
jgi:glyoxylase-like metal-dependent hydrolase (beta-lactamase superfamily II)